MKYFGFLCMLLIVSMTVQPICAAEQTRVCISDQYGNYQKQYNPEYSVEKFKATLYKVKGVEAETLATCHLDFYLYKITPDGSGITVYYHDEKLTGSDGTAETSSIHFNPGDYILVVSYRGNSASKLSPSYSTVKIHAS